MSHPATERVHWTIADLDLLPDNSTRYEIIDGELLMTRTPQWSHQKVAQIQTEFNNWLLETFQRKVFLAIACESFPVKQLESPFDAGQTPLAQIWQRVNDKLTAKASKFAQQLNQILEAQDSHQPCKVCHRDDVPEDKLKPLNELEDDSVLACCTCRAMFRLGDRLPEVKAMVRSSRKYREDDIQIEGAKFPLYQAAKSAGGAEDAAKDNGRDRLSLFGETFKWEQWLGCRQGPRNIDVASGEYLQSEKIVPNLQGVLPFMQDLLNPQTLEFSYPQSFIRNLLITAQLREQKIKETQKLQPAQVKDVTYYLHLPKLAYALSRLPKSLQDQENFKPIRQSLMSPHNSPYFRAIATWIELLTRSNQS